MSWVPSVLGIVLNLLIIISLMKASKKRDLISTKTIKKSQTQVSKNEASSCGAKSILRNKKNNKYLQKKTVFKSLSDLELSGNANKDFQKIRNQSRFKKVTNFLVPQISQERQITIMLISISLTFLILTLPFSIHELHRKLYPYEKKFQNRITQRTVLFFLDCLHATNFILYCLIGKKFRNALMNVLLSKKEARDKSLPKTSSAYNSHACVI